MFNNYKTFETTFAGRKVVIETGKMAMGIGMGQSTGTVSFIRPTYEIRNTGEVYTIDGVTMEFQMTPGTEAPAEMNIWFPEMKALWVAENCTTTLHNLYTLRGAQIRDGNAWAKYITENEEWFLRRKNDHIESLNKMISQDSYQTKYYIIFKVF